MVETDTQLSPIGSSNEGIVVYDGKCEICRRLALKINNKSGDDISIRPLESSEAQELLGRFYPEGPGHDFYFVKGDSCSKGLRAVPKIVQATGVREFGGLMSEYFDIKYLASDSEDCSCDQDDTSAPAALSTSKGRLTRRAFAGVAAAAATTLMPGTAIGREQKRIRTGPPQKQEVRVATVTRDRQGGFDTTISNRPDLIHEPPSFDEEEEGESKSQRAFSVTRSTDKVNFERGPFGKDGQLSIDKVSSTYDVKNAAPGIQQAAKLQDKVADDAGKMDIYSGVVDARRFELAVNVGRGPAVLEGGNPGIATTMASKVQHDLAYPAVDFVVPEVPDASVSEYIDAYVAGIDSLQSFYSENGLGEMASVYGDVGEGLRKARRSFARSVDDSDLTPMSSYLGVSGVPNFARYALPPKESQPPVTIGASCDSGCECGIDVCCGCGIGAGVCTTPIGKICGCCVLDCSCDIIECCADIL